MKTSHNSHWQRKKETSDSSFGQASTMLEKVSYQIPYHPKQNDANALLFCSKSKGTYAPMSAENVNKMLKKYATMAHERCQDVPMDLHAHQFRHAKASH